MSRKEGNISHKAIFDSVVQNAIDFFKKSISELKKEPKYSVINFCSAIELFLKARLMLEHWSLIIVKPEQANFDKFIMGDFQSVSMDGAIDRLANIGRVIIHPDESKCFNQAREHRNKLVHFFHTKYTGDPDKKTIQAIVSEQCKGWYYLHKLLTENWKKEFASYSNEIKELDELMRKQRHFLAAKYDVLKKQIAEDGKNGTKCFTCFSCGYEALQQTEILSPLMDRECLVCKAGRNVLEVSCPKCGKMIYVEDIGEGKCEHCEEEIDLEYLIDGFGEDEHSKDYHIDPSHAYCDVCEYTERPTVVPLDEHWLCLWCLTLHEEVDNCNYCGTLCTGDLSDSGFAGCVLCEGSIAHMDD